MLHRLETTIAALERAGEPLVVALSGGVDSSLVAAAAGRVAAGRVVAVTADHALVARREVARARDMAARLGLTHRVLTPDPLADPVVRANGPDRCYGCKRALFAAIRREYGECPLLDGTNADDDPARPGLRAAREFGVAAPLRDCGLGKDAVRALAREWGLPSWDRPSESCLATRIPTGEPLRPEQLARVERMESFFHALGVPTLRARPDNLVATVEYLPQYRSIMEENRDNFAAVIAGIGLCSCRFREWRA